MVDVSSSVKTSTCTNTTTTNTTLRSTLNVPAAYRGTTYTYPQKAIIPLLSQCLQELGFLVSAVVDNYQNHIVLKDYSENVALQIFNMDASVNYACFLFPRVATPAVALSAVFNSGTSCRAALRMIGGGIGQTKTALLLGGSLAPTLSGDAMLYFTEAKFLPTGDIKKAIVAESGTTYCCYFYDSDWTFLPGYESNLTTLVYTNANWANISPFSVTSNQHDPYASYYLLQAAEDFPVVTAMTRDGLWEFPDIIFAPYGIANESDTVEKLKYSLTDGVVYQIGERKYLCNVAHASNFLLRVE